MDAESGFRFVQHGRLRTVVDAGGFRDPWEVSPRLSPDGRFIAYVNDSRVSVVSTETGESRRLIHSFGSQGDFAPAWSPDGHKLAFLRGNRDGYEGAVYAVNVDGSDQRLIARNASEFAWSPDGRKLVIDSQPKDEGRHETGRLYVTDLRGSILRQLDTASQGFGLTWAPADKIAYVHDRGNSNQDKCWD